MRNQITIRTISTDMPIIPIILALSVRRMIMKWDSYASEVSTHHRTVSSTTTATAVQIGCVLIIFVN